MKFEKGQSGNPSGKAPGTANKATTDARAAIALFVERNSERLNGWLDAIAKEDPLAAFECFMKVVEFHIPKLQRTVVTGEMVHKYVLRSPEVSLTVEDWKDKNPQVTLQ